MKGRKAGRESGFALLLVFLMAALIAISLYSQLPRVAFESQRAKEQLLIERGEQYKRAIQLFVRKNNRYPAEIKDLENTNNIRFLRRRYTDPMTGKEEWRVIRCGPGGVLIDSVNSKPGKEKEGASQNTFVAELPGLGAAPQQGGQANLAMRRRASEMGGQPGGSGQPPDMAGIAPQPEQPPGPNAPPGVPEQPGVQPGVPGVQPGVAGQPGTPGYPGQYGLRGQVIPGQPGMPVQVVPGQPPMPGMPGQPGIPGLLPGQPGIPGQPGVAPGTPGYPAQGQPGGGGGSFVGGGSSYVGGAPAGAPAAPPARVYPGAVPPTNRPGYPYPSAQPPQAARPGYPQPGAQGGQNEAVRMIQQILTSPRPQGAPAASSAGMGNQTIGGGVAGVASTLEQESIMLYEEHQSYNEWEFIYDMSKDRTNAGARGGMGTPQGQQPAGPGGGRSPLQTPQQTGPFGSPRR